ncbi:MAG: helix-turn-helix transcriptional regulator [Gammaproteobacteria bacterium]|nr:helix-turn-helix transcriptional regulator [Gammaproteobacteria bacterium]
MKSLLEQLKKRRLALGMKQKDMMLRIGISRQQYQQLESKGNPRLNTLELVSQGLKSELMLIPNEKVNLVKEILESDSQLTTTAPTTQPNKASKQGEESTLENDPWKHLLGDDE